MRENDGELALLYAVLERAVLDAVCCFASQSKSERDTHVYNKRCARAWLFLPPLNKSDPEPFTLVWICEYLGLAPDRIQRFVKRLIADYPAGAPLQNGRHPSEHIRQIFAELLEGETPYSLNIGKDKREST